MNLFLALKKNDIYIFILYIYIYAPVLKFNFVQRQEKIHLLTLYYQIPVLLTTINTPLDRQTMPKEV